MLYSRTFLEPFGRSRESIFKLSFETQSLKIALVELRSFQGFLSNAVNKLFEAIYIYEIFKKISKQIKLKVRITGIK